MIHQPVPRDARLARERGRHDRDREVAAGGHFTVTIVSSAFAGKPRVARHRLVYDALADAMQRGIHALAIVAYTPEEFNESSI
ncbi:BolA family protein [Burkholderia cenocepacia]|uniref:BolA family protein n=1 Tax=Burkholderia cenocepacia TaxID=95486 RepID=UPI003F49EEAC